MNADPGPGGIRIIEHEVFQDWRVNQGRRKSQVVLALFRFASLCSRSGGGLARLYVVFYKVLTNWFMGIELPPEATIGAELRLLHPHAIVLHPAARMGDRCTLRQCTTLGNLDRASGPSGAPTVGDDVELGAGVLIIGERQIGDGATVGAGAVVVSDVAAEAVVAGNPARPIGGAKPPRRGSDPEEGAASTP